MPYPTLMFLAALVAAFSAIRSAYGLVPAIAGTAAALAVLTAVRLHRPGRRYRPRHASHL